MSKITVKKPYAHIDGVKSSVADKIYKILQKGTRYFGSSGAFMSHQAFNPEYTENEELAKEYAIEQLEAERETSLFLKEWVKDKPNVVILESVRVPNNHESEKELHEETKIIEGIDTDHVLIVGDEIILIDTKRWTKKKNYSVDNDGNALKTNKPFGGGEAYMNKHIDEWLEYLDDDAYITGITVINQEETKVTRNKNWYTTNYRLVEWDRFEELLNEKWETIDEEDLETINTTLVSQILVRCIKPFDPYSKVFDMDSLRKFK